MPGSMSRDDLVADLKASLHDAANVFDAASDADFDRLLGAAARDLGRFRPYIKRASITIAADTAEYDAPSDLVDFSYDTWSLPAKMPRPWEVNYPGAAPRVVAVGASTARTLLFCPAPSAAHIAVLGSSFTFVYRAAHVIGVNANDTTVSPADRSLLILRAQAEAMSEMAMRNIARPTTMRDGMTQGTRNGTPAYLFEALMKSFGEQACN